MARQKKIIVVGYLRVSGKGQINGFGFDRQEETIKSWATHNGATISHLYREEASGTKDETHRPAFAEMVSDILSNVFNATDNFERLLSKFISPIFLPTHSKYFFDRSLRVAG